MASIGKVFGAEVNNRRAKTVKPIGLNSARKQKGKEIQKVEWCPEAESNHRHADFQSAALPTELSGRALLGSGKAPVR